MGMKVLNHVLFQNLIGNAIKYNDKKPPKIHLSAKEENNQYVISIKDNGIGIKQEQLRSYIYNIPTVTWQR